LESMLSLIPFWRAGPALVLECYDSIQKIIYKLIKLHQQAMKYSPGSASGEILLNSGESSSHYSSYSLGRAERFRA
jgi:hypothetical protein